MNIQPGVIYKLNPFTIHEDCGLFENRLDLWDGSAKKIHRIRSYSTLIGEIIIFVLKLFGQQPKIAKLKDAVSDTVYYVNISSLQKRLKSGGCISQIALGCLNIETQPPAEPGHAVLADPKPAKGKPAHAAALEKKKFEPVNVSINKKVLDLKCSDHSIVTFMTPDGPIISSNVMCSGEDHDPKAANSFGIDPREEKGRRERFEAMLGELACDAGQSFTASGQLPVIALQEFPRRKTTGAQEFTKMIGKFLPDHVPYFGAREKADHDTSQLCVLVPKGKSVEPVKQKNPRIQVILIDKIAYVNIHPSPADKKSPSDTLQEELKKICTDLLQNGKADRVHIVGDWNRKRAELEKYWTHIDSPQFQSHLPPLAFPHSKPQPIDHHVTVTK